MGIPKAAIRQKMIMDSIPEAEINDFFGDNLSNGSQPSSGRKESLAPKQINPALKKFEKMLAMGADTELKNRGGDTALLLAIKGGDQTNINLVLEAHCNVMEPNNKGK